MIQCPACPVQLQALEAHTSWPQKAWNYAQGMDRVPRVPTGKKDLPVFLALTCHANVVHPDLDLATFLEEGMKR